MQFWRIAEPEYDSDYERLHINGLLEHPFGLPGVKCDVCGEKWGGSGALPMECPLTFRNHHYLTNRWPISRKDHEKLQQELMKELGIEGEAFVRLRPGDDFQPSYLDVPSIPRADFLWPGPGNLVVSERVKELLQNVCPREITACPVILRRIGKHDADQTPHIPSTGEPEDMILEVPLAENTSKLHPYFTIIIQRESGLPPGTETASECPGCRRLAVDRSQRTLRMTSSMWDGSHIFYLATTKYILMTDELKTRMEELRPANVSFTRI